MAGHLLVPQVSEARGDAGSRNDDLRSRPAAVPSIGVIARRWRFQQLPGRHRTRSVYIAHAASVARFCMRARVTGTCTRVPSNSLCFALCIP